MFSLHRNVLIDRFEHLNYVLIMLAVFRMNLLYLEGAYTCMRIKLNNAAFSPTF